MSTHGNIKSLHNNHLTHNCRSILTDIDIPPAIKHKGSSSKCEILISEIYRALADKDLSAAYDIIVLVPLQHLLPAPVSCLSFHPISFSVNRLTASHPAHTLSTMQGNAAIAVIFTCVLLGSLALYFALKVACLKLAYETWKVGRKETVNIELAPPSA